MEAAEAIRAVGRARRRSAMPTRNRPGPADKAPDNATRRPAQRTKIKVKREKAADDRHKYLPAANPSRNRDNAHDKGHNKED